MSIQVSNFYSATGGAAIKFDAIGDGFVGVIVDAVMVPDMHNAGAEVLKVEVYVDDAAPEEQLGTFYCRSAGQREAVGKAVVAAGVDALEVGGQLSVQYVGNKSLHGGKTLKLYEAKYKAPTDGGATAGTGIAF